MVDAIRIHSRMNGSVPLWHLLIDGKHKQEMNRKEIHALIDHLVTYYRYAVTDDFRLETPSGPAKLHRSRVYQFGMEAISVMPRLTVPNL